MIAAPRPSSSLLAVRFPNMAAANRRVAGMSVAGRWAARAAEAGLQIAAVAPDASPWPAATREDFRRTRVFPEPAALDAAPPAATPLDGRYLPSAAALRRVAPPGGAPGDAIDLAAPDAARRIVQATAKPTDGVVSRWLNRPVSQRVSVLLLRVAPDIRPSQVTAAVALVAVAMALALLFGGARGLVVGGLLFHLASVLDGVDGELARATYCSSPEGAALDTRVDMLTNLGFFFGAGVALARVYGGAQAALGGLVLGVALTGLAMLAWLARRMGQHGSLDLLKPYYRQRFPTGPLRAATELMVTVTSRDFFAFAAAVLIVIGAGWAILPIILFFGALWLLAILAAAPVLLRQAPGPVTDISAAPPFRGLSAARRAARR